MLLKMVGGPAAGRHGRLDQIRVVNLRVTFILQTYEGSSTGKSAERRCGINLVARIGRIPYNAVDYR